MLNKAIRKAIALERGTVLVKHQKSNTWVQSDPHKDAWREVYRIANRMADEINARGKRDIDASQILDIHLADSSLHFVSSHDPADDHLCGDMSCMQALAVKQKEFCQDILREIIQCDDATIRERLWNLYDEEIKGLRSVDYQVLEDFGSTDDFVEHQVLSDADNHSDYKEYRDSNLPHYEQDPDDACRVGDSFRVNPGSVRIHKIDGKLRYSKKPRGSQGVLEGLYENTLPEPSYTDQKYYRKCRYNLMHQYAREGDKVNAEVMCYSIGLKPKFALSKYKLESKKVKPRVYIRCLGAVL